MKLTKKQRNKIAELYLSGMKLREISRKLKIHFTTVRYNATDKARNQIKKTSSDSFRKKSLEERRVVYKKRKNYLREYQRRRYNEDEEFRKINQERARDYYRKKHSKWKQNKK